jgi:transglutaminase-like putative cysteine protease
MKKDDLNYMIKRVSSCFIFLIIFYSISFAQSALTFDQYKSKYSDKQAVMLVKKETVKITLDKNDSLDISVNYYSEMLHLADQTEGLAESSVYFSGFIELKDLQAKTLVPYKTSYKPLKVTKFETKSQNSSGIFYDDNQSKVFNYPGVQPGAKTILSYTQIYKESKLLSPYYFNFYVPVVESELTIMLDKRLKVSFRMFHNKDSKIKFSESIEGNFIVYKWVGKDLSEYVRESNAQNISFHEPHVIYFVEEIKSKKRNEVLLKDVKDLYRWYYSMSIKGQKPVSNDLKFIVDSLTAGVTSPYEKTKKIFYWVQDHVKYVAFEDGYGGFIPRDASLVCDRRFGDCKDMANLLVQMLTSVGLSAYHTWIGTRDISYSYADVPAPNVDNHMIAAVKIDGKYIFLDATGRYGTLDLPTSMIQSKEALIGIDETHFEIVKVPVIEAIKNISSDTTYCRIDNKLLKGNGKINLTGYNKVNYTYAVNGTKEKDMKELMKEICTKGSNKFALMNYSTKNIDSKDLPLEISYEFELEDYVKSNSGEIYINLNLDRSFDKDRIDTLKRKLPVEHDYKYLQEDVIFFEIPAGFVVSYLPSAIKEKNNFFETEISYKVQGSKIIYSKKVILNTLLLERKDFNEWNKIINKLSQAYREVIVLKQK